MCATRQRADTLFFSHSLSYPTGALKAYDKAIELHRRASRARPLANDFGGAENGAPTPPAVPVRLLNNAAVLHLRYGNLPAALPLIEEAVEVGITSAL